MACTSWGPTRGGASQAPLAARQAKHRCLRTCLQLPALRRDATRCSAPWLSTPTAAWRPALPCIAVQNFSPCPFYPCTDSSVPAVVSFKPQADCSPSSSPRASIPIRGAAPVSPDQLFCKQPCNLPAACVLQRPACEEGISQSLSLRCRQLLCVRHTAPVELLWNRNNCLTAQRA